MVTISVSEPQKLDIDQRDALPPGEGEIAIQVIRAGICGSDMHILHGSNPFVTYPRIIGHEFAGVITALGRGVSHLAIGDHVVADPVISCGKCHPCRIGRSNVCAKLQVIGVHRDGGFRSVAVISQENAVKISPSLGFDVAALAEPLAVAANVLSRTECGADDVVMIYGAGTVGITVLQVAKMRGARCIIADIDPQRLERALEFGADVVINSREKSVPEEVAAEMEGLGPSVVIDGAGIPALLNEACRIAGPAGRIGLLGFSAAPCKVSQQEIVRKELSLVGSRLNRRFIPEIVQWLEVGKLKPVDMITQTFDAADARKAFNLVEKHPEQTLKVQLAFDA
ncbi:Zn-dependent oxidoreductase [Rhizobium sp. VS19-DR104.2]|uniref:Zn-dependent oxidoreductase n=1 Tax=unclassified Rhizobium TaxID=2613769 RepID=UPI001CC3DBB6|nr:MULTISPECIES: Zn-dependent oxidoreductase [unclassified Rhizobium]MBZ5763156.1 Zn-dependent oxidoreductase [Rhizobium sp. VS19-DR96]MBZ5769072.1 Zn-dependent oxidoreductase [Rhizobium sp. VS19-DR129.2]MBZ5776639.1 Zn-dependent oxidoreductase [Rhizobium sp. VS19-DRK62.2]MBZ5787775.1 Zn-dependent oxidoreductase [Rhizobium sp. VS19-DR121]MBZ5805137.1 Zn-dependent oxidoreductase [Rhizobium sp. VS19-DR181]